MSNQGHMNFKRLYLLNGASYQIELECSYRQGVQADTGVGGGDTKTMISPSTSFGDLITS